MNTRPTVVATIACALALSACGSSSSGTTGSTTPSASPSAGASSAAGGSNKTLAFIQGVAGDNFYISMQCGIQAEAQKLGYTVSTQGPTKFDPTLQTPIVDSVVATKPAAILIAPTDVKAMEHPIQAAADAGIKIILVDTTLTNPAMAASQISSDNVGGGAAAFDAVKKLVPGGGKLLVISTNPGVSTVDARIKGFQDAAAKDSTFKTLGVQYSNNEPQKAAQIMNAALQKDPDIKGVFATNLFSAEGAATGLRQAGKQGAVKIIGFDAGPDQVKALEAGTVQALIAQQPETIGMDGVDQADKALTGGSPTAEIKTGFTIVTKDNMSDPTVKNALYKAAC